MKTLTSCLHHLCVERLERETASLAKFKKNLEEDPIYAFEWGDSAFETAANLSIIRRTMHYCELCISKDQEVDGAALRQLFKRDLYSLSSSMNSTNHSHNLIHMFQLKALIQFLDDSSFGYTLGVMLHEAARMV